MKNFESRLIEESEQWVEQGIINSDQKNRILALHPPLAGSSNRLIGILTVIGGALLTAGVVLFISSNWEQIGDWTKILGLLALIAGAHFGGYYLKFLPGNYPKSGEACFMMGCILFLAGIALVSQIFHLNGRPATGVLAWWIGIAAIPFVTRSRGAQFVSITAFLTWLGMEFYTENSWLTLRSGGDLLYHGEFFFMQWVALFFILGLALFASGLALRRGAFREFAGTHEKWGLIVLHITLYALSFYRYAGRYHDQNSRFEWLLNLNWIPVVLTCGLLYLTVRWAWKKDPSELRITGPWFALSLLPVLGILSGWNPETLWGWDPEARNFSGWFRPGSGWIWSLMAWATLFCLDLSLIRAGASKEREFWINLGIGFIALNIITRYFDLFGSMMEGALLFITSGALILGGGIYLERKRRHLLASMKKEVI